MSWRYVMSRQSFPDGAGGQEEVWSIRELYTDGEDKIGWSKDAMGPKGDTWIELGDDLARMTAAVAARRVLDLTLDPPQLVERPRRKS